MHLLNFIVTYYYYLVNEMPDVPAPRGVYEPIFFFLSLDQTENCGREYFRINCTLREILSSLARAVISNNRKLTR